MRGRRFVIPDIHGCARTFHRLLEDVIGLRKTDALYLLGDMIDRGPRSKEVLDSVLRLRADGHDIQPLRGNHEEMLLQSCRNRSSFRIWMLNGGQTTLASFGVEDGCEIPLPYRIFLETLPHFVLLDEFVLVHGGLNFQSPDPFSDTEAMLWCRNTIVDTCRTGGRRVVSGHTPLSFNEIKRSINTDRIMLDNGCVYAGSYDLGSLTALELDSMTLYTQRNIESEPEEF